MREQVVAGTCAHAQMRPAMKTKRLCSLFFPDNTHMTQSRKHATMPETVNTLLGCRACP